MAAMADGRERSSSPGSPGKRRHSTAGVAQPDASLPKRAKHYHDGEIEDGEILDDAVAVSMDVDADSADRGSDYRKGKSGGHATRSRESGRERRSSRVVVRDRHGDRRDRRERHRHVERSRSRGRSDSTRESARARDEREGRRGISSQPEDYERKRDTSNDVRDAGPKLCEETKGNPFKEEGKEGYQAKTEYQVAGKIEKAGTRKISIVLKSMQQEKQQEVKPIPSIINKTAHLKDKVGEGTKHDSSKVSAKKAKQSDPSAVTNSGGSFNNPPAAIRKSGNQRKDHHDNWDDEDGYYTYRFGESLNGRYEITAAHGRGVFSTVVRAKDLQAEKDDPAQVAIKIVRNNDTMYRAGKQEISILGRLASADSKDKHHCVRFISSFRDKNHLCLVFESLSMNLREALKRRTGNHGFKLTTVRAYSKQLFIALKHLKNCKVLHCDIKLDNILLNDTKNFVKLCDFGSAMLAGMNEVTPYLVSRYYRAPEIILGLPYDHPLDMWSVGCCLYELCTGKVLFPGPSNNDMLRLHMEWKGPIPKKMLRKGAFSKEHFNRDLNFEAINEDPVTKKVTRMLVLNTKPKGFGSLVSNISGEDPKLLSSFRDLLDKIFVLDPEKRITVEQALSHPFITGKFK